MVLNQQSDVPLVVLPYSLALVQNHIEPDNLHNKRGICKAEVDEESSKEAGTQT